MPLPSYPAAFKPESPEAQAHGTGLRTYHEDRGISQAAMARKLGISASQLSRIESGDKPFPLGILVNVAHQLGCQPGDLLPESSPWTGLFHNFGWGTQNNTSSEAIQDVCLALGEMKRIRAVLDATMDTLSNALPAHLREQADIQPTERRKAASQLADKVA